MIRFVPKTTSGEKWFVASMLTIIFLVEGVLGLQGFCMADEGWSLTGYQQIFNEPSSIFAYTFMFYNKLLVGGLWEQLFGWMGIYGFRLLNILFMMTTSGVVYFMLRRYVNRYAIALGLFLVLMAHNYGVMVFDHSSMTVLLSALGAAFLFKALKGGEARWMVLAAACLTINIFSRIPNLATLGLLLLIIPYYLYERNLRKTMFLVLAALGGIIIGIGIEIGIMTLLGHHELFIKNLTTGFSAATSDDSSHNIGTMATVYLESYFQIAKDILKIGVLPTVMAFVIKPNVRNSSTLALITLLGIGQICLCVYFFDNMLFVYSFVSIILAIAIKIFWHDKERMYLLLIAIGMMYLMPLGSDFGIINMGENAIWVATPLSVGLAAEILKQTKDTKKLAGVVSLYAFIMVFVIMNAWHIMHNAYFDEGPRYEKIYRPNHPLATTFTKKAFAQSTNKILREINRYVKPNDYLLCFQSRPMLHYLTHTRPYMHNPWPWSFDSASMQVYMQDAEENIQELPVILREKGQMIDFTKPDELWDRTDAEDDFGHKNAKVQLINDFIRKHKYHVVWESDEYQILKVQ